MNQLKIETALIKDKIQRIEHSVADLDKVKQIEHFRQLLVNSTLSNWKKKVKIAYTHQHLDLICRQEDLGLRNSDT